MKLIIINKDKPIICGLQIIGFWLLRFINIYKEKILTTLDILILNWYTNYSYITSVIFVEERKNAAESKNNERRYYCSVC